jgi:hypothetical protein
LLYFCIIEHSIISSTIVAALQHWTPRQLLLLLLLVVFCMPEGHSLQQVS